MSLTNPKTLLFFGAFFPQFLVRNGTAIKGQIFLLSTTFLMLAIVLDGCWAIFAGRMLTLLATRGRVRNGVSGGMLIGAGIGLALARRR